MTDTVFGLLAVLVGLVLCLRGQWALRVLLALWGGFVGLAVGGILVEALAGDPFLTTWQGWVVGIVLAILFASVAYLFYAVGITLGLAAMGFVLGGTLASALGVTTPWVVVLVSVVLAVVLAMLSIVGDLPRIILIVLSTLTGASLLVGGLMLLTGVIDNRDLLGATVGLQQHPWWYAAYLIAAVVGVLVQLRRGPSARR